MQHLIKKRIFKLILLAMISTIFVSLVGCGSFNEDNAKKESRIVLDKFLKVSDNKTVIANDTEMKKIREFIDNKCKKYFTADFINDTNNELSIKSFGITPKVFYLSNILEKVRFYNNYKISSPTVDKENETITYILESNEVGIAPTMNVSIQMKKENGKWKINKTLE